MGLLGKILLVFNLLAAAGFVYLALEDWTLRQEAAAAVLRHQIVLTGLPFDGPPLPSGDDPAIPFAYSTPGGNVTETVSRVFLQTYFQSAAGTSTLGGTDIVASQMAEVKRVRQRVQQILNAPGTNRAFAAANFLEPLAETLDAREEIVRLRQQNNGDELAARLMARFDAVETPTASRDATERQLQAAHLLVLLSPEQNWQKRVVLVIGLPRYKATLTAQAVRYERLLQQVQRLIAQDQINYSDQIRALEAQAISLTEKLMDSQKRKVAAEGQQRKDVEHRDRVQTQVNDLTARVTELRTQMDRALVQQAAAEQKLFNYQRMVGATLEEIFRLEADLARKETGSRGGRQ